MFTDPKQLKRQINTVEFQEHHNIMIRRRNGEKVVEYLVLCMTL